MSAAKHTPGPWAQLPEEADRPYIRIRGTRLGGRHKVANVLTPVYEGVHRRELEETRANAHLIATAPEMFEELNMILQSIEGGGDIVTFNEVVVARYRALIAKAQGGAA